MARQLKIWNGRGLGGRVQRCHIYVAAYSKKQAVEIINESTNSHIKTYEITTYFSDGCWGNNMDGIEATEPCVYIDTNGKKPVQIYPIKPNQDLKKIVQELLAR